MDDRIKADNIRSLKNLYLAEDVTLTDLVDLQSMVNFKLEAFDQSYGKLLETDNRIRRNNYEQVWQKLLRQLKTIQEQIVNLAKFLNKESQVEDIQTLELELAIKQQRTRNKNSSVRDSLKTLQDDKQKLQSELTKSLVRAINQAKVNKVTQDLQNKE